MYADFRCYRQDHEIEIPGANTATTAATRAATGRIKRATGRKSMTRRERWLWCGFVSLLIAMVVLTW
jgi:hypothetical protein